MGNKNLIELSNGNLYTVGKMSFIYPTLVQGIDVKKYNVDGTAPHHVLGDNAVYNENYHKRMVLTKAGDIHVMIELKNI